MVRTTWPLLLAAALGLVPFTIFSNFLVDIAADAHGHSSTIGSFRGLGGIAAVIVGVLCAPLIDAIPRQRLINLALATLGLGCALSVVSHTSTWIAFCLIIGAGTAVLNPAISAQASDTFHNDAEAGRAATLVSSTMTLTAMLAAPILAGPALIWGWQGNMIVVAITCLLTVAIISRRRAHQTSITAHTEHKTQPTQHTTPPIAPHPQTYEATPQTTSPRSPSRPEHPQPFHCWEYRCCVPPHSWGSSPLSQCSITTTSDYPPKFSPGYGASPACHSSWETGSAAKPLNPSNPQVPWHSS